MSSGLIILAVPVKRIIDLRHRVLRQGLPRESAIFAGDELATSIHLAAFSGDALVGCATLHRTGENSCQLRGMAVEEAFQRGGVGSAILREIERRAALRAEMIWANCRSPAVPFYRKHNWRAVSEEFVIETAGPHIKMQKSLG